MEDVKFVQSLWSNSSNYMAKLEANMIKQASEIELYIILATLETFDTLELDTFNHVISSCQTKPFQGSQAMIGFS